MLSVFILPHFKYEWKLSVSDLLLPETTQNSVAYFFLLPLYIVWAHIGGSPLKFLISLKSSGTRDWSQLMLLLGWVSRNGFLLTCSICFSMAFLSVCLWFGLLQHGSLRVTTYIPWRLVSKRKKAEGALDQLSVLRTVTGHLSLPLLVRAITECSQIQIHQIDGRSGLCCRKACRV